MANDKSTNISTGDISGTGIAIGTDVQATVTINQQTQQELLDLIQQLRRRSRTRSSRTGQRKCC